MNTNTNLNTLFKNFNIINYNEITRNIEHWNPYEQYIDISFFDNKTQYFILGPVNSEKLRYLWKFKMRYVNDEFILYSTENSNNSNSCIKLTIKEKVGKIDYKIIWAEADGKTINDISSVFDDIQKLVIKINK